MKAINVERDKNGMWVHPELPTWGENISDAQAETWFASQGLTHHLVLMDGDFGERWGKGELESCAEWQPETEVKDAFLVGIWDTEDGVVAMFASPLVIEVPKQVHLDVWVAEYARLLISQCHFDLATAIDMGKAALENVDEEIEGYSPSDAVDDEIAAMRDCC
ncbi:hypothetical protein ABCL16_003434 [Vibrio parahaemolyticus]